MPPPPTPHTQTQRYLCIWTACTALSLARCDVLAEPLITDRNMSRCSYTYSKNLSTISSPHPTCSSFARTDHNPRTCEPLFGASQQQCCLYERGSTAPTCACMWHQLQHDKPSSPSCTHLGTCLCCGSTHSSIHQGKGNCRSTEQHNEASSKEQLKDTAGYSEGPRRQLTCAVVLCAHGSVGMRSLQSRAQTHRTQTFRPSNIGHLSKRWLIARSVHCCILHSHTLLHQPSQRLLWRLQT